MLIPGCFFSGYAQHADSVHLWSSYRQKVIPLKDTLLLDSLTIDPRSLAFDTVSTSGAEYEILPGTGILVWKVKPAGDSIRLSYRVFPFSLSEVYRHKRIRELMDTNIAFPYYALSGEDTQDANFVDFNSIHYQGSYGRSLSLGNQQDLSLNSRFNLQLDGYILDSIRIEAALTDNNIPLQPEGNTRQIQEFDRIFVTFSKGRHKLTAGDYQIGKPDAYFLNFGKRVQGLMFETGFPHNENVQNTFTFSGSIAKGQFARNVFMGQEGNQGPYKLTGNNGEQFFIILAGSEKVYMDGFLLERGEDRDYTINYNTAEISFMPRRMITRERRIQVEFEYQDRNYLNTLFYLKDELKIGDKWEFRWNAYSNQDAKNQPYLQSLDAAQKQFLSTIGDNIDQAFYRNIVTDTFAADKVLYKMIDTLVNGVVYDSVFVYSSNPDSAHYNLSFSYVGEGRGNYIISGMNTNGRSYTWLAPENGVPQGDYAPVILLITPKMHQLFSTAGAYHIDTAQQVFFELAASNYAPNLFSDLDKARHWGYAGKGGYEGTAYLGKADTLGRRNWAWSNHLSYEWVQNTFRAIAPFRNVEFARDWNLQEADSLQQPDDHFLQFKTKLSWKQILQVGYDYAYYKKGNNYSGNRNILSLNYEQNQTRAGALFNLLLTENSRLNTRFLRPSAFIEHKFENLGGIVLGTRFEQERNLLLSRPADQLQQGSFSFNRYALYLNREEDAGNNFNLKYEYRTDDSNSIHELIPFSRSHSVEGRFELNSLSGQQIGFTGAYRNLMLEDGFQENINSGEKIVARLEYNGVLWKRFLTPALLYEVGSGQEQRLEQVYIEVPAGQGQYMWVDYNEDGVQQANEFELGLYPDQKKYMLVITPTQDYQRVNYVTLTHSLNINPENLFEGRDRKKWQIFLSRFSNQFTLQINNKVLATEGMAGFNPFASTFADTSIITNNTSLNNTFFFNRKSSAWGIDYNYGYHSGKSLLTYGLESQLRQRHHIKARWNFVKNLTALLHARQGRTMYISALNDDRTYRIDNRSLNPELVWLMPSMFRFTGAYEWDERTNAIFYGGETAQVQKVKLELRFTFPNLGILQGRGTYADIRYSGKPNTPVAFSMLESLQPGTNWLWYLNWERRIGKGIEISLEYEGRKPGAQEVIHTGRMSIRAIL